MIIAVNFPIQAIGKKKPEKIRASTSFHSSREDTNSTN